MKENSISYKTAKQETERLICETEEMTITHRAYTAECLRRVLKENEELKSKNKTLEELLQGNLYELYKYYKELAGTYQGNSIPVQKVKDKISERQFELQQEYKDFEDDAILTVLQELIEGRK